MGDECIERQVFGCGGQSDKAKMGKSVGSEKYQGLRNSSKPLI